MSIIKVNKTALPFAQIPNSTLRDLRLPLDSLGLLAKLLSRPSGWEVRVRALQAECGVGREKIRRMLHDLEENGYLSRHQVRRQAGKFDWVSEVRDVPATMDGLPVGGSPTDGSATDGWAVHIERKTDKQKIEEKKKELSSSVRATAWGGDEEASPARGGSAAPPWHSPPPLRGGARQSR